MALIFIGLMFVSFFASHYLNEITDSHHRATVLSFKGLAFNLAYGMIGIFFALLMQYERKQGLNIHPDWQQDIIESFAFKAAIGWFPWYTIITLSVIILYCSFRLKNNPDSGGRNEK